MTTQKQANLSVGTLRDRLKARRDQLNNGDDVDIDEALAYLLAVPDEKHTPETVDALVQAARNFDYAGQPAKALQAASHAARFADPLGLKSLFCAARGLEGNALASLGRFAEAIVAHFESWSLAREVHDKRRETWALLNLGISYGATGQYEVAIRYFERSLELAKQNDLADCKFSALSSLAACAVELREPAAALRAFSQLRVDEPQTRLDMFVFATFHHNLARLYLLVGDVGTARVHAEKSAGLARTARMERMTRANEALFGLIDVLSGSVERGLSSVEQALTFARDKDHAELSDFLGICIDAYEAASHSDVALLYLHELVAWEKKSIEAKTSLLQSGGFVESPQFVADFTRRDDGLLAKEHLLQGNVRDRIQRFVETAINAEIASGHDLYRTFRVAKLARFLAAAVGWDEERIARLALGAQLCNIGMMAIPARILQKPRGLSPGEREILRHHTQYGAELLRKSKLRILNIAGVIAEQHHERYDETGYPKGLGGESIAEEARIVSICDAFDSMTHRCPWRVEPLSTQAALNELKQGAATQFDPRLVKAFVDLIQRESWEHDDFDTFLAEGAHEFEYVRARARMEALIGEGG